MLSFSEGSLSSGDDSLVQRGIGYTFIRHLIDQRARRAGASAADDVQVSDSVTWLCNTILNSTARGWSHSLLAGLSDSDFQAWFRSVLGASDGYLQPGPRRPVKSLVSTLTGNLPLPRVSTFILRPQFEELFGQMAIMRVLLRSPAGMSCR